MNWLLFAASATEPTGDDLMGVAIALAVVALIITAIATIIITPRAHHDDH